jgi:hypothetical protein
VRKQIWAMGAIGAAVGAAVVLTLLFSEDSPTTAAHVGEAILIAVGALSTFAAIGLFYLAFQEVPRLRIGEPVAEARQNPAHHVATTPLERTSGAPVSPPSFVTASMGPDGAQQALDVAQLHVRNVPKRGSSRARGVYVRLNFHDSTTGASVQSVWARWSDAPPGDVPGAAQFAPQVDIPGNGDGVRFDVVAIFHDDAQCHAVDPNSESNGWRALPLGPHSVVNVIARGANAKSDSAWYEVIHGASGGTVRLAATDRPSW